MHNHIDADIIQHKLDAHTPAPEGVLTYSSVLMPIFKTENGYEFLFCKRSMSLKHQPGDICVPGGRRENNETPLETALRETCEEIGVCSENIEILGETDFVVTAYGSVITPFVGLIHGVSPSDIIINKDEVDEIFLVPLSFFMNTEPEIHYVNIKFDIPDDFPFEHIVGGRNYPWSVGNQPELFYFYDKYVIWGFTARIVNNLCKILGK